MTTEARIQVTISRISEQLFSGEARSVTVPGVEGVMTLLPRHEALITLLKKGTITVVTTEDEKHFEILGGMLETSNNEITILV